ncbi:LysR family transcriptional regulator [Photobacterium angustum]|uniref:LysR family transcriptional regulator n=1 Tax=Photobacterium angustum TaxID=661 RepID=A0A855SEB9_PHOAN|nr:LysR substrate-binding domain-containing protein [Photobacterium angustum]KJF83625.1 LysR family transcriptional regulator [Photobacterium damselae subsp. damselae]KJG31657.1 LysR family transcriptional regulator [Photobacterium angustum]KJG42505.1 LysR family transcriptional regulator [Photobacterium angustum]KJG47933.1 LysR family transcriptional regulator [Photobacterium angustum]KJG49802.1 LysR family transcriptional regulator [Photobacterium angustum]
MRVIPPIKAIIYFEAAARLQSFKLAAEELCVTPSAVSHQINTLEDFIEQKLFQRHNRSIILTNAGLRYFSRTTIILNELEQATTDLGISKNQKLTIAIPPTLLNKWLLPLINIRQLSQQGISLNFIDTLETLDFGKENIDIAIRYGLEPPEHHEYDVLFKEKMVAVCTPDYIPSSKVKLTEQLLSEITLIETTNRLIQWDLVLHNMKIKPNKNQSKVFFQNSIQAIEAACNGLGIAFVNRILVQKQLNEGTLVERLNIVYINDKMPTYYLVCPQENKNNPSTALLYDSMLQLSKIK